jgi:hypothetical protein
MQISLAKKGIHHNVDILYITPEGADAVKLLRNEIRGLVMPPRWEKGQQLKLPEI